MECLIYIEPYKSVQLHHCIASMLMFSVTFELFPMHLLEQQKNRKLYLIKSTTQHFLLDIKDDYEDEGRSSYNL